MSDSGSHKNTVVKSSGWQYCAASDTLINADASVVVWVSVVWSFSDIDTVLIRFRPYNLLVNVGKYSAG